MDINAVSRCADRTGELDFKGLEGATKGEEAAPGPPNLHGMSKSIPRPLALILYMQALSQWPVSSVLMKLSLARALCVEAGGGDT